MKRVGLNKELRFCQRGHLVLEEKNSSMESILQPVLGRAQREKEDFVYKNSP